MESCVMLSVSAIVCVGAIFTWSGSSIPALVIASAIRWLNGTIKFEYWIELIKQLEPVRYLNLILLDNINQR